MKPNETDCIQLAPQFRFQWEAAQDCYVLLYPEGMVKLNPSAGEILQRCCTDAGGKTVAALIAELEHQFPEAEGLRADVYDFLEIAHDNGWIHFSQPA